MQFWRSTEVDADRGKLVGDLVQQPGFGAPWVEAFQTVSSGHNGGDDPFWTDGRLPVLTALRPSP